jgi:acetyltransferase-like isoleucine patch superfamily enzyme
VALVIPITGLSVASPRAARGQLVPIGGEFPVHAKTSGSQRWPDVAIRDDGAFVVVWADGTYPSDRILAQRFGPTGTPIGASFMVDDPGTYTGRPSAAMAPRGEFVVTWGGARRVNAQRFDAAGRPQGGWFDVAASGYYGHQVAMGRSGAFVVAWAGYMTGAFARLYDADGSELSGDLALGPAWMRPDSYSPAVATGRQGDFVATWVLENPRDPFDHDILGQRFDPQGTPLGREFQINTFTPETQGFGQSVAMAADGSFVVVWQSEWQDGDDGGIFGQRYDARGLRSGHEFQINTRTQGRQYGPSLTVGANGDFIVAWTSGWEPTTTSVLVQQFDRDGRRVGAELRVDSGAEPVQGSLSSALADNGVLVMAWESGADWSTSDLRARRFRWARADVGDADADGIANGIDNCPTIANPDQADAQGDGYGDACVSPDVVIPSSALLGRNPVIGRGTIVQDGVSIGDDVTIGDDVRLERQSRAGDRLRADDYVAIGRFARIGNDVSLGFATRLEGNVTVGDGVVIADQVIVRRGVTIGSGARIDALAVLFAGALIGDRAIIESGARIGRGATVAPGAIVPSGTTVTAGTMFP